MSGQPGKLAGLLSPVFLRVVLGVTFIWAGLGKLIPSVPVQGVDAALLSNAGLSLDPGRRRPPQPAEDEAAPPQLDPPQPLPLPAPGDAAPQSERRNRPRPIPSPDDEYATGVAAVPAVEIDMAPLASLAREPAQGARGKGKQAQAAVKQKQPTTTPTPPPSILDQPAEPAEAAPPPAPATKPAAKPPAKKSPRPLATSQDKSAAWPRHLPVGKANAKDYPNPVEVQRVNEVTLLLIKSAFPAPLENGKARMSIWPQRLALDPWPRYMAWAAALTELFCGGMMLVGFFTRTSAVILCLTMFNAIWLTTIGPAIASENAILGILPDRTWWAPKEWATPLWQFAIVAMCLSVAFAGAGWLSLDRFFAAAGGKKKADEEDEE